MSADECSTSAAIVAANQEDRASQKRYLEEARSVVREARRPPAARRGTARPRADPRSWERDFDARANTVTRESRDRSRDRRSPSPREGRRRTRRTSPSTRATSPPAERLFEEALRRAREVEADRTGEGGALQPRARRSRAGTTRPRQRRCSARASRSGTTSPPQLPGAAVEGLAAVAVARGDAATAARLLGAAEEWRRNDGLRNRPVRLRARRPDRRSRAEGARRGRILSVGAEGARLELDEAVELALTIQGKS